VTRVINFAILDLAPTGTRFLCETPVYKNLNENMSQWKLVQLELGNLTFAAFIVQIGIAVRIKTCISGA
jgi:hypothetical protein